MLSSVKKISTQGLLFLKNNPHILYTAFLLIIIPFAFLVSGEQFLNAATKNQERVEKERIGLMTDTFAGMLREGEYFELSFPQEFKAGDSFLQSVIEGLKRENSSIVGLKIVLRNAGRNVVIASLNEREVGLSDTVNNDVYSSAGLDTSRSIIFENFYDNERHWNAVRALSDVSGEIRGFMYVDISMKHIDDAAARNVQSAYVVLLGIVIVIVLLLMRQAKVVDYSVLYRKLKEVDQMKDDFVSMAAHELRTPLSVIKGYVNMISTNHLSDMDKEGISRVNLSVENLNNLVGDILDVVKIEQGKLQFNLQSLDASVVIEEVVDLLKYLAAEKNLFLTYDKQTLPIVSIDPIRFKQALINIIGNAIKYTPSGSVSVSAKEENKNVIIRVRDTGIGVSAEDQRHLFTKFLRIRSKETEDIRGTGLGLWITAQLVSGMGGTIYVESIKGKGSDFVLVFPIVTTQDKK